MLHKYFGKIKDYRVVKGGGPRGGGSLIFPKVPQSSLGILRVLQLRGRTNPFKEQKSHRTHRPGKGGNLPTVLKEIHGLTWLETEHK